MILTERGRANVQSLIDEYLRLGDAVGAWTMKCQARQTGVSHYLTFDNKVDVMTALAFIERMDQSPPLLVDACEKFLVADALAAEFAETLSHGPCARASDNGGYRCGTTDDGSPDPSGPICPTCKARNILAQRYDRTRSHA